MAWVFVSVTAMLDISPNVGKSLDIRPRLKESMHETGIDRGRIYAPPTPSTLVGEVDGSTYHDLPGLVWELKLSMSMIGDFPISERFSFLLAWQRIISEQFVLKVVQQGYSLPFVGSPPLSKVPVDTSLPWLQLNTDVLWEEIASPFTKGAWKLSICHRTSGNSIPVTSWLRSALVGSAPFSALLDSTCTPVFQTSIWRPSTLVIWGLHQG